MVAFSFDDGKPIAQTWDERSPRFRTLWKPGNNGAIKAFASQVAALRTFAFSEFQGSTKATTFRVGGLASRLTPLLAQCASNAVVAEAGAAAATAASMATNAYASFVRVSGELAELQAARAIGGASPSMRLPSLEPTAERRRVSETGR